MSRTTVVHPFLGLLRGSSLGVAGLAVIAGCSPSTSGVDGSLPDLSVARHDLGPACAPVTGNLVGNPSFEQLASGADPDGKASNVVNTPTSNIPGPWAGCCGNTITTNYSVTIEAARCGSRSMKVVSNGASMNVLHQDLSLASSVGKSFTLTGYFLVQSTSNGGSILLDFWDDSAKVVIGTPLALKAATTDWFQVMQTGTVPTGGVVQVRINSSGTVTAFIDDLSLTVQ